MRVLIIDNFDSFTYNLYQTIGEILLSASTDRFARPDVNVVRNNAVTLKDIERYAPTHIVISPGPGSPEDPAYFGVCREAILHFGRAVPVLGVCLGMQGIAHCFGARIRNAPMPVHGKTSRVLHRDVGVFAGLPQGLEVMRYHSLMVDRSTLPDCFEVTAYTHDFAPSAAEEDRIVMGIRHLALPIEGVQFHPESFATEGTRDLLGNFLYKRIPHTDGYRLVA